MYTNLDKKAFLLLIENMFFISFKFFYIYNYVLEEWYIKDIAPQEFYLENIADGIEEVDIIR